MNLIFITNEPQKAEIAEQAGVDRIMVDLEINNKERRQGHLNTVISKHTLADVVRLRKVLTRSKLLVRINPIYSETEAEIERILDSGAEVLMLPMFTKRTEVDFFIKAVRGRAKTCLLLETPQAFVRAEDILETQGIDEVLVGLNDLHLGMGLTFMFELLAFGIVERLAVQVKSRGILFGFGGVGRVNTGILPAELILSEHVRLESEQVILSRDFHKIFVENEQNPCETFLLEVSRIRQNLAQLQKADHDVLKTNTTKMERIVKEYVGAR